MDGSDKVLLASLFVGDTKSFDTGATDDKSHGTKHKLDQPNGSPSREPDKAGSRCKCIEEEVISRNNPRRRTTGFESTSIGTYSS
jgi:hypothetical protein